MRDNILFGKAYQHAWYNKVHKLSQDHCLYTPCHCHCQLPCCKHYCHHQFSSLKPAFTPRSLKLVLFFQTLRVSPLGIRPRYKELLHLDNDNHHHHHPCHHHDHLKGGRSWKHLVRRPEGSSCPRKGSLSGYDSHATRNSGTFSHWIIKFNTFCNNSQKGTHFFS